MGMYLDSKTAYILFQNETKRPYFVDKSLMLSELFPLVDNGGEYICITRPRRFGKTVMANMIDTFFNKMNDSSDIFNSLKIAKDESYRRYQNQYPVIHIPFNDLMQPCHSYDDYIGRIEKQLLADLKAAYPDVNMKGETSVASALLNILAADDTARFIFVLDEWDFIFHQSFASEEDKKNYLLFLRNLLKDRPYVLLAYITGILPIAKYSSGSELNMFVEYTMASEEKYSQYFGFTEEETDMLFERYENSAIKPKHLTREGMKSWYDGYHTKSGRRIYNPRSVVTSLKNNNFGNYWTSSGPYDEIFYYIEHNVAAVRDDLALMIAGIAVPVKVWEYAATAMNLQTREEIFSAMVVYGFLTYENGKVSIPNRELLDKFTIMLQKEPSLGYIYRLAKESRRMLQATLTGDTETMVEILELAHDTEVPLLSYNSEAELTAVVNLVYLAARDNYRIEREDKAGIGYADFIFYPETDKNADCIILELKVGATPEAAIQQIKDRKYALRFRGKIGEPQRYTGRILAVGISYDKEGKKHSCKIEVIEDGKE
ncbi:AAA family ATPase [Faecalicatena orotica]|uniref:PD-(D/E)XK nuclease superfamily protein n=1 Tax=Faecalicatena orotica TaxID=1544 RepID=A0A2Y9BC60_9FIRM|nr:AAA family ATPase [Faecalicatena orotica]PWJ30899.1 PD-(D/E)XK nuclease superfamily protein [Faecalicatena orotica]SSA55061.1 PD-(D/E)XK nuclease superfamily protein [Faecalicatena orotica]